MITTTPRAVLLSLMTGIGDPLVVRPSDLHSNLQRAILGVLARRGAGTNTVTIEDDLAGHFDREEVKQEVRVCYMGEQAYSDAQYAALVERLHREASVAALKRGANAVLERLGDGETPEQVAPVVAAMLEATRPEVADEVEEVGERVADLFEIDDTSSVPLGLDCMADLRVCPGALCILAARPGGGKTALLGTWAVAAATRGWRVLFLSLEMPSKQIRQRLLAAHSRVPLHEVTNPVGSELVPAVTALTALPIGIRDAVAGETLTVERIAALVRAYRKKFPEPLAVFVDYIQLIRSREKHERRHELLGHVCRELKACALREQVPMIVAAQVGRGVEQRGKDAKPQLSDLRESGEIENTADQVVLVHREGLGDKVLLAVAKYRMGAPFVAEARFEGQFCLFADAEPFTLRDWTQNNG